MNVPDAGHARQFSPFSLHGRLAVVTGARRGIGLAIAEGLAGAGADELPVIRVGRMIFPGEARPAAASAAWRDVAPLRRRA